MANEVAVMEAEEVTYQTMWAESATACYPFALQPTPKFRGPTLNLERTGQHIANPINPTKNIQTHVPSQ
ncbi:hypothetical protein HN873_049775 [Arachis hypogaea]